MYLAKWIVWLYCACYGDAIFDYLHKLTTSFKWPNDLW